MFVPTGFGQPAAALAPVEIAAAASGTLAGPARTAFAVYSSRLDVLSGHRLSVTGSLLQPPHTGLAAETVALQARDARGWTTLVHTRTGASGRFRLTYTPQRIGSEPVRLRFAGDRSEQGTHRRLGRMNVFRLAEASWYGGGGGLACGGTLTSGTLGVASRTLPCGKLVTLRYGGRTIRVPVIDRGPYVEGREFDLTEATKQRLGFGDTGELWSTG
jgi:hypothetical protein